MASGQCVLCGASLVRVRQYVFKTSVFRKVYADQNVYRCTDCGLKQCVHQHVDAAKLDAYYQTQYRPVAQIAQAELGAKTPWFVARAKALTSVLSEHRGSLDVKRVFELGAGYGANLLAVQGAFPDANLFTDEIDESITLPPQVKRGRLFDGNYDVLILSHVLEHFIDPVSVLRTCSGALNADGLLIVEVPNCPHDWLGIDGFDEPHVSFFTKETLQRTMADVAGLSCLCCYACGPLDSRETVFRTFKRVVRGALAQYPVVKELTRKLIRVCSNAPVVPDFITPREQGIFLRAAYRKTT